MLETIKNNIAEAFNALEADMRWVNPEKQLNDKKLSIIERKASQMKKELNLYIDSQVDRIKTGSENREHTEHQVIE